MKSATLLAVNTASSSIASSPSDRGSVLGALGIFLLTVACHLPLLGSAPLAGTEGHRVFPALDMVRSGDWLLPRLFGQLYLIKPPLHDWLIAIAQIVSRNHGNEFVWRLPSVIVGALLNVALYFFGARWFGRVGGIVSGLCGLGLLCLWGQARTADVDATNQLACSVAALCLIELYFGRPTRKWIWTIGAGAAVGATLMSKGPAGLPLIIGVVVWASWSRVVQRRRAVSESDAAADSSQPALVPSHHVEYRAAPILTKPQPLPGTSLLGPLLIGVGLFGVYAVAAKLALNRLHLPPDYSGVAEVGNKFYPSSFLQLARAFSVPWQLFAFTLPVSVALPLVFVPEFRNAIAAAERDNDMPRARLTRALAASLLISWGICVATGMVNTRYAYVTVAPLCLLAAAVATSLPYQIPEAQSVFRIIVLGCVVLLVAGNGVLAGMAWRGHIGHIAMPCAFGIALIIAIATCRQLPVEKHPRAAWGMVALIVCAAVPFAYQFRLERFDRSGFGQAEPVREYIGGSNAPVLTGAVLHSLPELFWYAGLHPQVTPTFALQNPRQYPGGTWVIMDPEEYRRWSIFAPQRLKRVKQFISHKDVLYVAWFDREESVPTSTEPTTHPAASGKAVE
jgi:hypothetical protein